MDELLKSELISEYPTLLTTDVQSRPAIFVQDLSSDCHLGPLAIWYLD